MPSPGAGPTIVVVMGVSASGKSTFGKKLAQRLNVPFVEGDDFHPPRNIARMSAGRPLDDADREPWLHTLANWIRDTTRARRGAVVSCSALKLTYRELLRAAGPGVWFVHLDLEREIARRRITHRTGHFMPEELLASQYDALQPLLGDEPGLTVDATGDTETILDRVQTALAAFESERRDTTTD
ncbi:MULTISPECIES: gluconokinase [unclassified Streptomyces]|uniref:gluconokinase n=1 Tax=unclassified Streptomyces TaxID=2593676 RepID=UPI0033A08747